LFLLISRPLYPSESPAQGDSLQKAWLFVTVTHGLKLGKTVRILPTEHGTDGAFAAVLNVAGT